MIVGVVDVFVIVGVGVVSGDSVVVVVVAVGVVAVDEVVVNAVNAVIGVDVVVDNIDVDLC